MPCTIDQPSPCRRQEPRGGVVRNPDARPGFERCPKGVAERILGSGDIARAYREKRDQPTVGLACSPLECETRFHRPLFQRWKVGADLDGGANGATAGPIEG